ncbi:MAG TPA: Ig-like domain-containing protein [Terriglobales bacterium]|nr:Ig-like domain-containing protein [Terriglobales bacterium]
MPSKRKLQIFAIATTLLLLAAGVGCTGFFVNPTLTGITVGPTATIQQSKTVQMTATGTYNDGSTKTLTKDIFWNSDTQSVATVNSSTGLVTGVSPGTSTITGASGSVSGTATITVTIANLTAIKVTPTNPLIKDGNSQAFIATGTANGQPVPITDSVTWSFSPSNTPGVSIDTSGNLTTDSSTTPTGTITVTATDPTTGISGSTNATID